jgi:hypothetical protein
MNATDIWNAATDRIPCKRELYMPVENFEFWRDKQNELTESRKAGNSNTGLWSRLSSKFSQKPQVAIQPPVKKQPTSAHRAGKGDNLYTEFMSLWKRKAGFDVIERTVGCSARYRGEPLLWVYPSYFQVAPKGKGNRHHHELKDRLHDHFPEARGKGTIQFSSSYFNWERFESFVNNVQRIIENEV